MLNKPSSQALLGGGESGNVDRINATGFIDLWTINCSFEPIVINYYLQLNTQLKINIVIPIA
jgi:hypothetical protein